VRGFVCFPFTLASYSKEPILKRWLTNVWCCKFRLYICVFRCFRHSLYTSAVFFLVFHGNERYDQLQPMRPTHQHAQHAQAVFMVTMRSQGPWPQCKPTSRHGWVPCVVLLGIPLLGRRRDVCDRCCLVTLLLFELRPTPRALNACARFRPDAEVFEYGCTPLWTLCRFYLALAVPVLCMLCDQNPSLPTKIEERLVAFCSLVGSQYLL